MIEQHAQSQNGKKGHGTDQSVNGIFFNDRFIKRVVGICDILIAALEFFLKGFFRAEYFDNRQSIHQVVYQFIGFAYLYL